MRIPIRVEFFAGGLRPMISFSLKSQEPQIFGLVNAIIDTGSPSTIIGWTDIRKMRISQIQMQKLIGKDKEVNLGGAQMKTRMLPHVDLTLGSKHISLASVQIPIREPEGSPPPTIVGIDFLTAGKFKFFLDVANHSGYLECED